MSRGKVATWICLAAAILLMVASLIPLSKSEPINVTFLGAGVVFVIVAAVLARKVRERERKSPT